MGTQSVTPYNCITIRLLNIRGGKLRNTNPKEIYGQVSVE